MNIPKENRGIIGKRIAKLRVEIERLRYRYHVINDPQITDEAYTSLRHELLELEKKYPEFRIDNSPTERLAGKPLGKFQKVPHIFRQWSLDDAFNFEELKAWEEKNMRILEKKLEGKSELDYTAEVKIDGLHIVLVYKKGVLETGATRGDGLIGENVTQNIKTIESIPLVLEKKLDVIVEGECWLSKQELTRINVERKKQNQPLFANARNAAAGSIRQLDPRIAASRRLDSFIYQLYPMAGGDFPFQITTQKEKLKILKKLGFKVNDNYRYCKNLEDAEAYFQEIAKVRSSLPYAIDGLVFKVNSLAQQNLLGFTGKSPRWGVAYKYPAETTTTVVREIQVQVGRTGALTPIAVLDPVPIAGSVVGRASLHNEEEIKRLDLRIGDTVVLRKAGDVIPEIVEVIKNLRSSQEKVFRMPSKCPICGSPVEKRFLKKDKLEAATYCSNKKCFAQEREKLIYFASKKGFNIEGLGDKIVGQLMETGLIRDFSDVFRLKEEDLTPLERFAELSAKNLVSAIDASKNIKIDKFINALGIRHIGEETAILVARYLEKQIDKAGAILPATLAAKAKSIDVEGWQEIKGVGDKAAESLLEYFYREENRKQMGIMGELGVRILLADIKNKAASSAAVVLKTFVFTGTLPSLGRDEAKEIARSVGGEVSNAISKKTDYLVAGKDAGSKLSKARALGVKIIGEEEFLKLIGKK